MKKTCVKLFMYQLETNFLNNECNNIPYYIMGPFMFIKMQYTFQQMDA